MESGIMELAREIVRAAEQAVREDWENSGQIYFFDQYSFQQCWSKIWKLIKIQNVKDILMRYRLVEDPDDVYAVSSPYLSPKQRADNLLSDIVPKAGDYGHYLLYIAIRESIPSNPLGHTQAIEELKMHAMGRQPPWTQETQPIEETVGNWEQVDGGMRPSFGNQRGQFVTRPTLIDRTSLGEELDTDSVRPRGDRQQQEEAPPSYDSLFGEQRTT